MLTIYYNDNNFFYLDDLRVVENALPRSKFITVKSTFIHFFYELQLIFMKIILKHFYYLLWQYNNLI